jgi:hypothetical protein
MRVEYDDVLPRQKQSGMQEKHVPGQGGPVRACGDDPYGQGAGCYKGKGEVSGWRRKL